MRIPLTAVIAATLLIGGGVSAEDYDPLRLPNDANVKTVELTVSDSQRDRDVPILVYLPPQQSAASLVLFSHGLGGSRYGSAFLGEHWAARGFVAVFLQHPGSDNSVWKNIARGQRFAAMNAAASGKNFLLRVGDVPAVLDQLDDWNEDSGHALHRRLNMDQIGMSGHSFGAVTTQAVSGQSLGRGRTPFTDPRIDAAVIFSPGTPRGGNPETAFGAVDIPWLLMTGTKDTSPIGGQTIESRLAVYPALPPGDKYELVLHNAEHSAFTDRALPGDTERRNPNHHKAILAISTAFWDAKLQDDTAAAAWLDGDGPQSVLESDDRWQSK